MPTYQIKAPDGSVYEVTGEGTEQDALAHVQSQLAQAPSAPAAPQQVAPQAAPQPQQDPQGRQYSIADNIGGAISEPVTSIVTGAIAAPLAGFAGLAQGAKNALFGENGVSAADRVALIQHALTYQPRTTAGKVTTAGISYPFEKFAQGVDWLGGKTTDATGSPVLGTAVNVGLNAIPAVVLRGRMKGAVSDASGTAVAEAKIALPARVAKSVEKPPAIEELKAAKDAAYKKADETGVVISRSALNRLKTELVNDLKKEGIDKDLHPKTTAAVKRILDTKGQLTLSEVETLRKIANDAKGSLEKSDARLGARVVDKIDDFEATLGEGDVVSGSAGSATAYKEARALNTRLSKARDIQELFDRAELTAPNFSGSGMENALRTEFRALAKNKNKMRRFTGEEQAAIRKVAVGGPVENVLRQLGKLAPTGVVSAGMGAMGGFAVGGPAGAAAVPAIGTASRYAATKMTMKNANKVGDLVRKGPQ